MVRPWPRQRKRGYTMQIAKIERFVKRRKAKAQIALPQCASFRRVLEAGWDPRVERSLRRHLTQLNRLVRKQPDPTAYMVEPEKKTAGNYYEGASVQKMLHRFKAMATAQNWIMIAESDESIVLSKPPVDLILSFDVDIVNQPTKVRYTVTKGNIVLVTEATHIRSDWTNMQRLFDIFLNSANNHAIRQGFTPKAKPKVKKHVRRPLVHQAKEDAKDIKRKYNMTSIAALSAAAALLILGSYKLYRRSKIVLPQRLSARLQLMVDQLRTRGWVPGNTMTEAQRRLVVLQMQGIKKQDAKQLLQMVKA